MRNALKSGFTLIEILIAMIVLSLGFLGIMFLFPVSIGSNRETVEETQAAMIADSFRASLDLALENAVYDKQTKKYRVVLSHDIKVDKTEVIYQFDLPTPDQGWVHHPGSIPPKISETAEDMIAFELNADPWVKARTKHIQEKLNPVEPYNQFMISFDIRHSDPAAKGVPTKVRKDLNFYEIRVNVFRKTGGLDKEGRPKKKAIAVIGYGKTVG